MATEKEAPKLKASAVTLRKVIKKPKPVKVKPAIATPYDTAWPPINADAADAIKKELRRTLKPLEIGKLQISQVHMEKLIAAKSISNKQKRRTALNEIKTSLKKEHWEAGNCHRKHIVFGLNNIYRQLEKGQLCAVLVCANISPSLMIEPLLPLCASRKVPAAAIPDLGSVLQPLMKFKSCSSMGLKMGVESDTSNVFHKLYYTVLKNAPVLKTFGKITNLESGASVKNSAPPTHEKMKSEITDKDYSHLYIMKTDKSKKAPKKTEDFIPLGNANNLPSEQDTSDLISPFRVQYEDLKMKNKNVQPPPAKKFRLGDSFESGYVISAKPNPPT